MTIRITTPTLDGLTLFRVLPSGLPVLCGSAERVEEMVGRLTVNESVRLALLDAGGIGKTALALAAREHAAVIQKDGDLRFFILCEQATSTLLFVELVVWGFRIETSSNDRMQDVTSFFATTDDPTLVILDNFETPWDIAGEQSRVGDIMSSIAAFLHISLLITI
ncbi:hypothetical protein FRB96_001696 [Tulasnella sp. 330]|nr:hypothetical protein FRB96_001696 [Tulasnella sp. 330]